MINNNRIVFGRSRSSGTCHHTAHRSIFYEYIVAVGFGVNYVVRFHIFFGQAFIGKPADNVSLYGRAVCNRNRIVISRALRKFGITAVHVSTQYCGSCSGRRKGIRIDRSATNRNGVVVGRRRTKAVPRLTN